MFERRLPYRAESHIYFFFILFFKPNICAIRIRAVALRNCCTYASVSSFRERRCKSWGEGSQGRKNERVSYRNVKAFVNRVQRALHSFGGPDEILAAWLTARHKYVLTESDVTSLLRNERAGEE